MHRLKSRLGGWLRSAVRRLPGGPERLQRIAFDCTDLTPETVLRGYLLGYFPMPDAQEGTVRWISPDPRGVLPVEEFYVPKNLRRLVRQRRFEVTVDSCFTDVIHACADREESWITSDIIEVYSELHRRGIAHSVETWQEGELVGGLYGLALGGYFTGESQFYRVRDASKIALVHVNQIMKERGFLLHDVQYMTPLFEQFGGRAIPRDEFRRRLLQAVLEPVCFAEHRHRDTSDTAPKQQDVEMEVALEATSIS